MFRTPLPSSTILLFLGSEDSSLELERLSLTFMHGVHVRCRYPRAAKGGGCLEKKEGGTLVFSIRRRRHCLSNPISWRPFDISLTPLCEDAMEVADVRGRRLTTGTRTATRDRVQKVSTRRMARGCD